MHPFAPSPYAGYVGPIPGPRFDRAALAERARGVYREVSVGASLGITAPATIFHRMDEVDAAVKATNSAAKALPAGDLHTRWAAWFADWQRFNENERSIAQLLSPVLWAARSDTIKQETENRALQHDQLRAEIEAATGKPVAGPTINFQKTPETSTADLIRLGIIGAAVVGGFVVVLLYTPEIKAGIAALRR